MTDMNTAYRNENETIEEDDPLAELARIVSGEPAKQSAPAQRAEMPSYPKAAESEDLDIEAQLMRELGEAEPAPAAAVPEIPPVALQQAQAFEQPEGPAITIAPVSNELSLEDQLMAELDGNNFVEEEQPAPAMPSAALEDVAPVERVEQVAAEISSGINPTFDDPDFDFTEGSVAQLAPTPEPEPEPAPVDAVDDDLDDFFADNFADMLETEQAAELDATPEGAPTGDGLEDFDFASALDEELVSEATHQPSSDGAIADEFAQAFEQQLTLETVEPAVSASAAGYVSAPQMDREPQFNANIDPQVSVNSLGDFDDSSYENSTPAKSGGGFKLAVGALCLALVVGVGVVGWGSLGGGDAGTGEPTIIKADTDPIKVKPDEPGGKQIANQDNQVYNKVAGNESEETAQDTLISSRETVNPEVKTDNRLAPKTEPETQATTLGISPKKVRTFTVKPDGTIVQSAPTESAPTQAASLTTPKVTAVEPAPAPITSDPSIVSLDGASTTGVIAIPQPSPLPAAVQIASAPVQPAPKPIVAPAPVAKAPAPKPVVAPAPSADAPTQIANLDATPAPVAPTVSSSEWKVQVSSQRSRDAAESSFNNIRNRFGSVLGGKSASIQQADVDGKGTFYRVKILADSKADATQLCSRLKAAGGSCFVTR
ncbi:MAG: SPOR domain-containing protein [Salaquimonas sp.]